MTAEEAIKVLEINKNTLFVFDKDPELYAAGLERHLMNKEAFALAIEALEKQMPKKPNKEILSYNAYSQWRKYSCLRCNEFLFSGTSLPPIKEAYCYKCGQAIDWSE